MVARSLQAQLWFVEVDWDIKPLRDSSEDVYRFMSEMEGMGEGLNSELPAGLMTMATKCYSPSCTGDYRCYAPRCPFKVSPDTFLGLKQPAIPIPAPSTPMKRGDWTQDVDPFVLRGMTEKQYTRQTIIRNAIESEVQYEADLTTLEKMFIQGLREADPPVIAPSRRLEQFIHDVFCNERELHEICRRLIDHFAIRERESPQQPLILSVGDIFLTAAADFRMAYPEYTGNLPAAEAIIKKEMEENPEFRFFCEVSWHTMVLGQADGSASYVRPIDGEISRTSSPGRPPSSSGTLPSSRRYSTRRKRTIPIATSWSRRWRAYRT